VKFISKLPDSRNYQLKSGGTRLHFVDRQAPAAQIVSAVPNPFEGEFKIVMGMQRQKSDRSEYPYRLILRVFPIDDESIPRLRLKRESVKGVFAWSGQPTVSFYALPQSRSNLWVFYSILEVLSNVNNTYP